MEAQVISQFAKNDTEQVRLSTRTYKDRLYLDLRLFFCPKGAEWFPSKKGITLPIEHLPALRDGLAKVEEAVAQVA